MATDYYAVLGVSKEAGDDELKRAYRRAAKEWHPDVNPDPVAAERFKDITRAYEVLSDPEKRRIHDLGGDPLSSNGGFGAGGFSDGNVGFGDIMDMFFGGSGSRGPRVRARPGQDALIRLDIELHEAVFGATRELAIDTAVLCGTCDGDGAAPGTVPTTCQMCKGRGEVQSVQRSFLGQVMTSRPCPTCQGFGSVIAQPCVQCSGEGRVRTRRSMTVRIPAGVDSGTRIHLEGEGEVGPNGGPPGSLFLEIRERPHPVFTRRGDDLFMTLALPMTAAALGATLPVTTLDGTEDISVAPGTDSGTVVTIGHKGVTHLRGGGRGDLKVRLDVQTPRNLDAEQTRLLTELAALRGEEKPHATVAGEHDPNSRGFFRKLKDHARG